MRTLAVIGMICSKAPARFWFMPLFLLASLGLVLGCGGKSGEKGGIQAEVTGKVTLGDKPVTGQVVFIYPDGKELAGPIIGDGAYTIADPPTGSVKVCVRSLGGGLTAPKAGGGPEMPKEGPAGGGGVPPPAKYGNPATSGLTYEVKTGKQTYNIELKP